MRRIGDLGRPCSKTIILILVGFTVLSSIITLNIDSGVLSLPQIDEAKVLIVVADGFDWIEYSDVKNNLTDQGATALTASYEKEELYGHHGEGPIIPNLTFTEVNVSEYDAFYIPGGLSPENLLKDPRSETVLNLIRKANEECLILSAICHGPWVLANASIVEGKNGTGYWEVGEYWIAAGGIWTYPNMVERDGNLLTARYEGLEEFKEALISAIAERLAHDVAVIKLVASESSVNVTVENQGTHTENFNVSTYYNLLTDPLIGTQTITLEPGTNTTLTFTWTPHTYGRYEIRAEASMVPDEVDTADNTRTTIIDVGGAGRGAGGVCGFRRMLQ